MTIETGVQPRLIFTLGCLACLLGFSVAAVEPLKPDKDDTIIVRANLAWEDSDESITYYRGDFELRTPDWSVQASEATVFGPLNNPDRVLLSGEPARIWISQPEKSKVVEGEGAQIEYLLTTESVALSGGAELKRWRRYNKQRIDSLQRQNRQLQRGPDRSRQSLDFT